MATHQTTSSSQAKKSSVFSLLGRYRVYITWLIVLGIIANGLTLYLPTLISDVIDAYVAGTPDLQNLIIIFGIFSVGILIFSYIQTIVQTYASERVARDLRFQLVNKISHQNYRFIQDKNPAKLLTNVTSDIDSIKQFVAQAIVSLVSSFVIIVGVIAILLYTDWKLALSVLTIIPIIGITFFIVLRKVRKLFKESREVIDGLNKTINESIVGAAVIRVLNSEFFEHVKFTTVNHKARSVGMGILKLFSILVPTITFVSSMGTLIVVTLGGFYVTTGAMSLGSFVAFTSYIVILVFPILVIGFISNIITQATVSYERINELLSAPDVTDSGTRTTPIDGAISIKNISLSFDGKEVLKNISFEVLPKTKTAIIGPTGSGKTQLMNIITGLTVPLSGSVLFNNAPITDYDSTTFYPQVGQVFQKSVLFNTTVRENIAFSITVTNETLKKALETAELDNFINSLPKGLDTIISERGTSLSGGQKQRIMLARALALDPKILFLDDFTARVDTSTEKRILANIKNNYPALTLISITQKIAPIEDYDQIILLIDGTIVASGRHKELLEHSLDYQQIFNSQRSTETV